MLYISIYDANRRTSHSTICSSACSSIVCLHSRITEGRRTNLLFNSISYNTICLLLNNPHPLLQPTSPASTIHINPLSPSPISFVARPPPTRPRPPDPYHPLCRKCLFQRGNCSSSMGNLVFFFEVGGGDLISIIIINFFFSVTFDCLWTCHLD